MYVHGTIPASAIRLHAVSGAPSSSVPNLWELHLRWQSRAHSAWGLGVSGLGVLLGFRVQGLALSARFRVYTGLACLGFRVYGHSHSRKMSIRWSFRSSSSATETSGCHPECPVTV